MNGCLTLRSSWYCLLQFLQRVVPMSGVLESVRTEGTHQLIEYTTIELHLRPPTLP